MKRTDPRYRNARSWVIRGAQRNPGIVFTASIGQYRLSCWYHDLGYHFHTWYGFEGR